VTVNLIGLQSVLNSHVVVCACIQADMIQFAQSVSQRRRHTPVLDQFGLRLLL